MTDQTMGPVELARAVEERGLHSLYVPEHTHIPTSRRTPPPTGDAELRRGVQAHARPVRRARDGRGGDRAARRRHRHLPRRAARSDRDRQGGRDASITLSGGRFVLGIGFGWNADEIARPRRRHEATGATSRASTCSRCRRCGATTSRRSTASSCRSRRRGRGRSRSHPGGPPVLIGGAPGPKLFAHVAEYADGWIPIGGAGVRAALPDLAPRVRGASVAIRRRCASCRSAPFPTRASSSTTRRSGSTRSCCGSPGGPRDRVLPRLDQLAGAGRVSARRPCVGLDVAGDAGRVARGRLHGRRRRRVPPRARAHADRRRRRRASSGWTLGDAADGRRRRCTRTARSLLDHLVVFTDDPDRTIAHATPSSGSRCGACASSATARTQTFFRAGEVDHRARRPDRRRRRAALGSRRRPSPISTRARGCSATGSGRSRTRRSPGAGSRRCATRRAG